MDKTIKDLEIGDYAAMHNKYAEVKGLYGSQHKYYANIDYEDIECGAWVTDVSDLDVDYINDEDSDSGQPEEKKISEMTQNELYDYAQKLGAESHETFLETAARLEESGEKATADIFRAMDIRWFELED